MCAAVSSVLTACVQRGGTFLTLFVEEDQYAMGTANGTQSIYAGP